MVLNCLCFWFPGVCIYHWWGRGGWKFNWHRCRGGHAQLICAHSDGHHHQPGSAVDGAAYSHLIRGTRAKRHGLQRHDAACCLGSLWHAWPKLLYCWKLHPTELRCAWPGATVSQPSPYSWRIGKWRQWWDDWCLIFDLEGLNTLFLFVQLTPEEEEKRRVRRERNKLAAAKCRNRRRELTDRLQSVSDAVLTYHFTSCDAL